MNRTKNNFRARVIEVVSQIPEGKVMTYGQIAALCGSPRAARIVGGIAHYGPLELPWHRVVNRKGGLASGYTYGGRKGQKQRLEQEGVVVDSMLRVKLEKVLWRP